MKERLEKRLERRMVAPFFFFCFLFFIIAYRIMYLQLSEGKHWDKISMRVNTESKKIISRDGNILDETGQVLVSSIKKYSIRFDPCDTAKYSNCGLNQKIFKDSLDFLCQSLSKYLKNKSEQEYKKMILDARKKPNRYLSIVKDITRSQFEELASFPIFNLGKYQGGFIVEEHYDRAYIYDELALRTFGYFKREDLKIGIEGFYSKKLYGKDGKMITKRIPGNYFMPPNPSDEISNKVVHGLDLKTNINILYQEIAETELYNQLKKYEAESGSMILMEVKTGKIKAIANLSQSRSDKETYFEDKNYALIDAGEPGSTFKLASVIALLEENKISIDDKVLVGKGERYYAQNLVMRDNAPSQFDSLTLKKCFEISSNVGISSGVYTVFKDKEKAFLDRLFEMKITKKSGIDIKGESQPSFPEHATWNSSTLPWMSIGYGLMLSPIQILNFYNAVANDGLMMKPYLVQALLGENEKIVESFSPQEMGVICSKNVVKKAQFLLEKVVKKGTAKNIRSSIVSIAGKTGTAQIAFGSEGYEKKGIKKYKASFVGYFPTNIPKYSAIVVINKPKVDKPSASKIVAPVFKNIAEKIYLYEKDLIKVEEEKETVFPIFAKHSLFNELSTCIEKLGLDITHNNYISKWIKITTHKTSYSLKKTDFETKTIPNLKGFSVKDALYVLDKLGIQVHLEGSGVITKQSVEPGMPIHKNEKILLTLK